LGLERLRWEDRSLYEYNAALVPIDQYPIHADTMRRYPAWTDSWNERVRPGSTADEAAT
jgi:hypothetical protein